MEMIHVEDVRRLLRAVHDTGRFSYQGGTQEWRGVSPPKFFNVHEDRSISGVPGQLPPAYNQMTFNPSSGACNPAEIAATFCMTELIAIDQLFSAAAVKIPVASTDDYRGGFRMYAELAYKARHSATDTELCTYGRLSTESQEAVLQMVSHWMMSLRHALDLVAQYGTDAPTHHAARVDVALVELARPLLAAQGLAHLARMGDVSRPVTDGDMVWQVAAVAYGDDGIPTAAEIRTETYWEYPEEDEDLA